MTQPLIEVRPLQYADRRLVFSVCKKETVAALSRVYWDVGSQSEKRYLDREAVLDQVDHLVSDCSVRVATIPSIAEDEIQGFLVEAKDTTTEYVYLREATYSRMPRPDLGAAVMRALFGAATEIVLRHNPSATTMGAIVAMGATVVVRPRAV